MKKLFGTLSIVFLLGMSTLVVEAGDINSAEASMISVGCGTYEKNGYYWHAKQEYINQVTSKLAEDGVDISASDAAGYIAQFYAAVGNPSYFDKVGEVPKAEGEEILAENPEGEVPVEGGEAVEHAPYTVTEMKSLMYVTGTPSLNVRKEPYKDTELLGVLHDGDEVNVTGVASNGWICIDYEGTEGFVFGAYLTTEKDGVQEDASVFEELSAEEPQEAATVTEPETKTDEGISEAADETKQQESAMSDETMTEEENAKDYSDAKPVQNHIGVGKIAMIVIVLTALVAAGILVWHKNKRR